MRTFLLPALRLGAASAVVGAVVAEVSIGLKGGLGRMVIDYAQSASGDPAKPWAPNMATALCLIRSSSSACRGRPAVVSLSPTAVTSICPAPAMPDRAAPRE